MYYAEQIVLGAEDMKGVDFAPISEGQLDVYKRQRQHGSILMSFTSCLIPSILQKIGRASCRERV